MNININNNAIMKAIDAEIEELSNGDVALRAGLYAVALHALVDPKNTPADAIPESIKTLLTCVSKKETTRPEFSLKGDYIVEIEDEAAAYPNKLTFFGVSLLVISLFIRVATENGYSVIVKNVDEEACEEEGKK